MTDTTRLDIATLCHLEALYRAEAHEKVQEGRQVTLEAQKGYKALATRRLIEAELLNVLAERLHDAQVSAQQEPTPPVEWAMVFGGFLLHAIRDGVSLCGQKARIWHSTDVENVPTCERCASEAA